MTRSLVILLWALALGAAIFVGAYFGAQHATVMCCENPADDLTWLRQEFHLSDAQMANIRKLHEGYQSKCQEICAQIATAKGELRDMVGSSTNLSIEAQAKLQQIAALRAECQSNMLQHFVIVSQSMPPAQGARYLSEMKRLTLTEHELVEQSMSGHPAHEHAH